MVTGCKLSKDDDSPDVDQSSYRSMIGSLLYITTSHPDIMHVVGMVRRYQVAPKKSHFQDVKRIFRYLKETMTYGLWYPRNQSLQLIAYSDVDWENCVDERKSTSGGEFFLGNSLVSWLSKKQGSISLSTIEVEYIAAATCCTQVLWMIQTLADLEVKYTAPIPIHCDNTSAISVSKNHVLHSKTKHIPIKYHFLREQVTNQIFQVHYIPTTEQIADIFTKPLAKTPNISDRSWVSFRFIPKRVHLVRGRFVLFDYLMPPKFTAIAQGEPISSLTLMSKGEKRIQVP
jgi:hypothetical protein